MPDYGVREPGVQQTCLESHSLRLGPDTVGFTLQPCRCRHPESSRTGVGHSGGGGCRGTDAGLFVSEMDVITHGST